MEKRKRSRCMTVVVYFFWIISLCAATTHGQTPTPTPAATPKSPEVLRLEEEKAQAQLRQAIAEANKAELEAKFPKPSSSPLAGTTTINDAALIESQMVAYASMARAANRIVQGLRNAPDLQIGRLAIFNEDDIKLLLSYKVTRVQIELLRADYCRLLSASQTDPSVCPRPPVDVTAAPNPIAAATIARSLLGTFVDFTSLLRTNVEIKGQTFDIDETPLVAEVFRAARRPGTGLPSTTEYFFPRIFAPDINAEREYAILGMLDKLLELRNTAGKLIADLEKNAEDIGKAETKIKTLEQSVEQLGNALEQKKTRLANLLKAHCPRLPAPDRTDPYGMEARLRTYCPRLPGEQRERVFELVEEIKATITELEKAKASLGKAQTALENLEAKRLELWKAFQKDVVGDPPDALKATNAATQLKARNAQVDQLVNSLVQVSTPGTTNTLTTLIKAENLKDALEAPGKKGYWLQVKVVKAGGNNRIKTNLVWDIFTGGNRLSHSGGAIVEYILFDTGGRALRSDTITVYTNYIKSGKIKNLPTTEIDDCWPEKNSTRCKEQ